MRPVVDTSCCRARPSAGTSDPAIAKDLGIHWVYCCAVSDAHTRKVVGWSIADHVRSELVVDALEMARWQRRPAPGTVVHSDSKTVTCRCSP